ncbi:hypothetical protein [Hyalangium minutum]|uniref:Lipoprotein n=1 Tax=Hyalangium minutum TaxID=394096 RepID=A0A085VZX8_9BACT|nr:hypothetical protein [Hyalangium minutum]KFE60991.1 hypothetical protein DB31_4615 [Hyalangium minutum]
MTRWPWAVAVLALTAGCTQDNKQAPPTRAQLRKVSGSTMEIVPSEGQLPYCLVYTVSQKGVIRQLTMTRENRSIKCDSGRPVANASFRVPAQEGPVKVYVFFSDQRVQAGSVAQQLFELQGRPRVTAMDFRLPGQAFVEMLEFIPEEGEQPVTGGVVSPAGEVEPGTGDQGLTEEMTGSPPEATDGGTAPTDAGT